MCASRLEPNLPSSFPSSLRSLRGGPRFTTGHQRAGNFSYPCRDPGHRYTLLARLSFFFLLSRDMLPLNCQNNPGNVIGNSVSNGESIQSLQSIDSNGTNLAMSPLSTMSMSPVAVNPCSPMGISPMAPRHPRYATPVAPSSVHTTHPHSGGLSPMNDVKALCYGRGVCETGESSSPPFRTRVSATSFSFSTMFLDVSGKDAEQTSVYYSSHSSMHHQYYQQTHHQMMSTAHHYQHHQQSMPTGYEIALPPPQHST